MILPCVCCLVEGCPACVCCTIEVCAALGVTSPWLAFCHVDEDQGGCDDYLAKCIEGKGDLALSGLPLVARGIPRGTLGTPLLTGGEYDLSLVGGGGEASESSMAEEEERECERRHERKGVRD